MGFWPPFSSYTTFSSFLTYTSHFFSPRLAVCLKRHTLTRNSDVLHRSCQWNCDAQSRAFWRTLGRRRERCGLTVILVLGSVISYSWWISSLLVFTFCASVTSVVIFFKYIFKNVQKKATIIWYKIYLHKYILIHILAKKKKKKKTLNAKTSVWNFSEIFFF